MGLSTRLLHAVRLGRPDRIVREAWSLGEKVARRAKKIDRRVVRMPPDGEGTPRGRVLLSYIVDPFLLPPDAEPSHAHTQDWECREMARAWREAGYAVDAIHWTNTGFEPDGPYDVLIDPRLNLERLGPRLDGCLKVLHAETAHYTFHNPAQEARRAALRERRGVELPAERMLEANRSLEHADAITLVGNHFTASTYASDGPLGEIGKPIFRVPLSNAFQYPFPEERDLTTARRRFVWFGSGGLVHKGLDLVLEAFAGLPDLHLTVCGPVDREPEFEREYWRELYRTPNIRPEGWVDAAPGGRFQRIARESIATVYPSCSEGGGGSVITCMHAGLIPVVTSEASIDVSPERGVPVRDATVEGVRRAVTGLAERPAAELDAMARAAWSHVREHHTRQSFARDYRRVVTELEALVDERRGERRPDRSTREVAS
jgi:glycosyltransferase involved in cell wall biosynthesis